MVCAKVSSSAFIAWLRAVARRRAAVQLRRPIFVEAHGEFRAVARFKPGQRGQRDHLTAGVPHVELADVLRLRAVVAFGFDVDLPLPSEAIEVVDEQAAHEGLDGPVDVVDGDALLDDLVAIDRDELLRHARQEGGAETADLRPLARRGHELVQVVREKLHVAARPVLENEGEAAGGADSGNRRRRETERHALRKLAQFRVQARLDLLELLGSGFSVAPFLHADKGEPVVAGSHQAEQAETRDAGDVSRRPAISAAIFWTFATTSSVRCERSGVGKLDVQVEVALVLIRNKTGGQFAADPQAGRGEAGQKNQRERALAKKRAGDANVAVGRPAERHD